jgi:hypothetical protein
MMVDCSPYSTQLSIQLPSLATTEADFSRARPSELLKSKPQHPLGYAQVKRHRSQAWVCIYLCRLGVRTSDGRTSLTLPLLRRISRA